jgi:hypothetical protein
MFVPCSSSLPRNIDLVQNIIPIAEGRFRIEHFMYGDFQIGWDLVSTDQKAGNCPVCKLMVLLNDQGKCTHHLDMKNSILYCKGSGQSPRKIQTSS